MSSVNGMTLATPRVNTSSLNIDFESLGPAEKKQLQQLDEAAKGFEQIFVQQMLKTAKFGSQVGSDGYGSMAMEAMSTSVTQNGGMGLATMIRDSMIKSQLPELASSLQSRPVGQPQPKAAEQQPLAPTHK